MRCSMASVATRSSGPAFRCSLFCRQGAACHAEPEWCRQGKGWACRKMVTKDHAYCVACSAGRAGVIAFREQQVVQVLLRACCSGVLQHALQTVLRSVFVLLALSICQGGQ